jgi:integrase
VLALNTTRRTCEIKALRCYDLDFLAGTAAVRKRKTEAGQRMIPLNEEASNAVKALPNLLRHKTAQRRSPGHRVKTQL